MLTFFFANLFTVAVNPLKPYNSNVTEKQSNFESSLEIIDPNTS